MKLINIHVPREGDPPFPIGYTTKCNWSLKITRILDAFSLARCLPLTWHWVSMSCSIEPVLLIKKSQFGNWVWPQSLKVHNVTVKTELLSLLLSQKLGKHLTNACSRKWLTLLESETMGLRTSRQVSHANGIWLVWTAIGHCCLTRIEWNRDEFH